MPRVVPAVIRALDILELFLDRPQLSAREVTERLDLPRTTVHELLVTLVARSYLISVPGQPVRYRLGMPLFQLGAAFAGQLDLVREAQSVARDVAAACDEAVHVAVLDGADVIYLVKVDSTHPVRMVSAVGRRLPAHCTAVGKILLSGLDQAGLDAVLTKGALPGMTPDSITDPDRLRAHLEQRPGRGRRGRHRRVRQRHALRRRGGPRPFRRDHRRDERLRADHPLDPAGARGVDQAGSRGRGHAVRPHGLPGPASIAGPPFRPEPHRNIDTSREVPLPSRPLDTISRTSFEISNGGVP